MYRTFFAASLAVSTGPFWAAGEVVKSREVVGAVRRVEARAAPPAERRRNDMVKKSSDGCLGYCNRYLSTRIDETEL